MLPLTSPSSEIASPLAEALRQRGALPAREAVALLIHLFEAWRSQPLPRADWRALRSEDVCLDAEGRWRWVLPPGTRSDAGADAAAEVAALAQWLHTVLAVQPSNTTGAGNGGQAPHPPSEPGRHSEQTLLKLLRRAATPTPPWPYADVDAFIDALKQWQRDAAAEDAVPEGSVPPAVGQLLRRMQHNSDFPALSGTVARIQSISSSDRESVATLTHEILKDVALTNKLLRVVNTAHFARGAPIGTVSRAVMLVGFNGIRNMALSLVLLEHMRDKAHAALLKEEFLRSLMAASIASELCRERGESEEGFLAALFQNLGRLLSEYYFPKEAGEIRALTARAQPVSENVAAQKVLGISYEALGDGIGRVWNLPDNIRSCMRKPSGPSPSSAPASPVERLRWVAQVANDIADTLLRSEREVSATQVPQIGLRHARVLGLNARQFESAIRVAREQLIEMAGAAEIRVEPDAAAARLLERPVATVVAAAPAPDNTAAAHAVLNDYPQPSPEVGQAAPIPVVKTDVLVAGIQDIAGAMVEDFKLSDILRMILETMYRAVGFRYIVLCVRDVKANTLAGRVGLGPGVDRILPLFQVPLRPDTTDWFGGICLKGADTLVHGGVAGAVPQGLPMWYRQTVKAPAFLVLPLMLKGAPLGMIYADMAQAGLTLSEQELSLLRTLRNQAVMAFRQSGG